MYSQCLIALGTEQAELLSQLLPSYDVVCLFILMQGYPLLNISVVPYEDHGLNQTIPPFDPTDEPAIERTESEVRTESRWLR